MSYHDEQRARLILTSHGVASTMNCEEIQNSLDFYLDGELAHLERWEVETHIDMCEHCAEVLGQRQALKSDLLELSRTPTPGRLKVRLEQAFPSWRSPAPHPMSLLDVATFEVPRWRRQRSWSPRVRTARR